jgi:hypothetical protein
MAKLTAEFVLERLVAKATAVARVAAGAGAVAVAAP